MKRATIDISSLLGYAVSAVMFVCGILVLAGWIGSPNMPSKFRWMFGIVMLLMGVYRLVATRTRKHQSKQRLDDEES